jgi:hypothetical protein
LVRLAGIYAGRILKGDKPVRTAGPASRPRPIINLKTAKVIGLAVPHRSSHCADGVIE